MTMQEGSRALGEGAAIRQRQDRAYFLDLLGDSLGGLGRYEAAVEAYRQAAQELEARGASCSYALCLLKIADSYLSLHEPWHAIGYLEACLPLLRELGLVRHVSLAQRQLTACQSELAQAYLLGERRAGQRRDGARPARPVTSAPPPRADRPTPPLPVRGKFNTCPVQTDSPTG
jgi:tetratricopeptide (TPR) repeat protein